MATRRPASSRSRTNNNDNVNPMAPPPPLPRSRSVMSRSGSNTLNDDFPPKNTTKATSTIEEHVKSSSQDDAGKNIQVVIRCRQRSEREIQDNSPSIVTSKGAKSKHVTIEVSAPVSSMGVVTLPPLRTYPFDLVFGPEADQAMIYHEVVAPLLDEVIMGYNCTLFAYGQTGTGKTYTMQGDLNPTPIGNPSANAGMIPRVLFRLFHHLEQSKSDFSVKVSYIELYNEELRDLLANDLPAPLGTTQPMGVASKDPNKTADYGLKIFDDSNKRGVMIQGLEEVTVKDSQGALALLTKGSLRRQIAATKFNDHSSRSHSVFSITVHVKEAGIVGEDLLKVGKLNLVDLAGSENIGRSGAENRRAREAGMINQSLLTLGRVITALVDKASHIPYRESKLTRLLQDSLGGRTKTCIIATISPARSNIEETLSTLDYALRAKSIRNKPELNQRTTRNSLLKEYISEIERLKADLVAAREKNGIFFSEETWKQMTAEQELRDTELEEAKKQVEIVETRMRGVREEFEQGIGLLKIREGELKDTRKKLRDTEEILQEKENELVVVRSALQEETVLRKAHQDTEIVLDHVASGLKKVAKHSVQDLKALFEKLERKTTVFNSNTRVVLTQGKTISTTGNSLMLILDEFVKSSSQNVLRLHSEAKEFQERNINTLASNHARIDTQIQLLQDAINTIQANDASEAEALRCAHNAIGEIHDTFTTGFKAWGEVLIKTSDTMSQEVGSTGIEAFATVERALKATVLLVETVIREICHHIDTDRDTIRQAKALANKASDAEIRRLDQQNGALLKMLEIESMKGVKAKDELVQCISSILGDFTLERDKSLREAFGAFQSGNSVGEREMRTFMKSHEVIMEKMENDDVAIIEALHRKNGEGKRTRDGAFKTLSTAKTKFNGEIEKLKGAVSGSVTSYSTQLQQQMEDMGKSCDGAFEQHTRAKRARIEATSSLGTNVQSEYRHMQSQIASISRSVKSISDDIGAQASGLANATEAYHDTVSASLLSLKNASKALSDTGAQDDETTGTTPRKRVWDYVDQWNITNSHETILKAWREQNVSKVSSETFLDEHLPLLEGGDMDGEAEASELQKIPVESENLLVTTTKAVAKTAPELKKGVPSIGMLTDARNVYTTRGSRRAR